ncbi:hypothetical protein PSTT_11165 [Puccinia striiformis]|uniref:Uncharacterized protein n=1 Tax=Puccinia striiformis TaxID=27350 RepID=A0A2S4V1P7_9BASI|nr:hypothetical protein PSTT_11165 [Puccinia striiformis]
MDIPLGAVSDLCRYPPPLRPVLFPVDTLAFFEERNQLVLVTSSNFFESDFPLTVGVVAESFVVMRGSGLPPASAGTRDRIVRSSVIRGSWWCFFLIVTSVVLGCVEFCWAGDPSFLDFNVFATDQPLPYHSHFPDHVQPSPTTTTLSVFASCPIHRSQSLSATTLPTGCVPSYGLRPRLPLTYSGAAGDAVADRDTACVASGAHPFSGSSGDPPSFSVAGSFGLRAGLGNPFTPRTPVRPPPVQSVDTPEWSFRVNRPDPFSPSSPINPFVVDRGTPETPPVRVRPSVGGSQALIVDRGATPPPAPRPRNASTPPSFESSPVAARWSSPSGASAVAGSSSGTPAPTRVTTPPVQGAYDPDDYHLLQRDQICLLLAPAPPLAPYDRYRFGPQASASRLLTYACGFVAYCHDFPTVDQAQLDRRVDIFEGLAQDLRDA